ncbi:MAG: hypothetical protein R3253_05385 [Longimicrobiales bacterium]|nr:hypothetical protein [Longimicrobiales bacterium]
MDFTQVTRPVVEVVDSSTIDYLLFELFIEPLEPPTRLQVIDVTQNGFGPDDVMVSYPSVEVFVIPEFIPDSVQTIMSGWTPEVEYRMDSGNMSTEALGGLIASGAGEENRAEGAILYDVVQAVERSYRDIPVALLFQRDSVGFTFQLWDYNRPAMNETERVDLLPDSAVSAVLQMLREVGYVPGENVVGTGISLESRGQGVVTVDRALEGMIRLPSERMRLLAAQTVLLGSYDLDRSGAIDRAVEIDAPTCAVWEALEEGFPDFLRQFGFDDSGEPYVGDAVLDIAENVRGPAYRRAGACLRGEVPPETDPREVAEPTSMGVLPESVERFVRLEAAGEILQRAGRLGTTSEEWAAEVRDILQKRFDRDRTGLLDRAVELRAIPCDVWQAMAATHPEYAYGMGFLAGDVYPGDHLGVGPSQRQEMMARAGDCVQATGQSVADDAAPAIPEGLSDFLDGLTAAQIGRAASAVEPGSLRWATLVQNSLVAQYDLDGSGSLDQTDEVTEIPCPVWRTIEATYGAPLSELGFGSDGEYFGDQIGITRDQRALATARIRGCQDR